MRKRAEREGRVDDTVEIHEKRMREFEKESPDVISFLKGEGDYKKVDCEPDFDVVYKGLPGLVKVKSSEWFLYGNQVVTDGI